MKRVTPFLLLAAIALSGCYHATVVTGLEPSLNVIERDFASSWVYGLVPPKTVETMAECPDGVARVETQLSFVNQLVSFLTAGIYTPMTIVVTCAAEGQASVDVRVREGEDVVRAFGDAADMAATSEAPVVVAFE
jgi:hypothetical protein